MRLGWVAVALLCGACNDYIYRPAVNARARVEGRPAAIYQVPPERPSGDVRLASFGVSKIHRASGDLKTMHVRMVVANNSARSWSLDTREQLAELKSGEKFAPAYANADRSGLPKLEIPAGEKATIDLYYPLPEGMTSAGKIPEFDVAWRIDTHERLVAERTPFERLRVETYYAGPGWGFGYGPYTWVGPMWGPGVIGAPTWY
jgi:hypothetical protein